MKWHGGDWPEEWVLARNISAKRLIDEFRQRKKMQNFQLVKPSIFMNAVLRVRQGSLELVTKKEAELPEENPFKFLFDPKTQERIPDPKNEKEMENHPYKEHFIAAKIKEKMENLGWKTYVEVPRNTVPKGTKILRPVVVYTTKYNNNGEIEKFKCRVCLDGSRVSVPESESYESIANFGIIRLLLCLACRFGMYIAVIDVKIFFLQARMPNDKEYFAEIPPGWEEGEPGKNVAKVLAPWYGLPEAAKLAGDQLVEAMEAAGMKENPWLPKVFFKWEGDDLTMCATHIDDAPWMFTNQDKFTKTTDMI